jgi:hypothetical protein
MQISDFIVSGQLTNICHSLYPGKEVKILQSIYK